MRCFVIMPFGDHRESPEFAAQQTTIYRFIELAVQSVKLPDGGGVTCHRADQELRPGEIIAHVIENLLTADIVVADLTGKNSNVFYELGVRHAVGNNTILIAQDIEDIPFDLRNQRAIEYSYDPGALIVLKETLQRAIGEVIGRPDVPDNPVQRYMNERKVAAVAAGPPQTGQDALKEVKAELSSLRKEFQAFAFGYREITRAITSRGENEVAPTATVGELKSFEGVWKGDDGSTYCVKVIEGVLFVPYCFQSSSSLTGHLYSIRVVGETLFARFEWFGGPATGHIFLKHNTSQGRLVGGWWYSDDVPAQLTQEASKLDTSLPGMNRLLVRRDTTVKGFPAWAEEYFEHIEAGKLNEEFRRRIGLHNLKHYR